MRETLRCQDRWERDLVLTDERWYGKILLDHPELTDALRAVRSTLTDPEFVNYDKSRDGVENYYRSVIVPPPFGRRLLKICVLFDGADGLVLTAYPVYNVNPGEPRKWP